LTTKHYLLKTGQFCGLCFTAFLIPKFLFALLLDVSVSLIYWDFGDKQRWKHNDSIASKQRNGFQSINFQRASHGHI